MFKELIDMFDFSMILVLKFYELFSKFSTYTFTPFKSTWVSYIFSMIAVKSSYVYLQWLMLPDFLLAIFLIANVTHEDRKMYADRKRENNRKNFLCTQDPFPSQLPMERFCLFLIFFLILFERDWSNLL